MKKESLQVREIKHPVVDAVACPNCGAGRGEPCFYIYRPFRSGREQRVNTKTHRERIDKYTEMETHDG